MDQSQKKKQTSPDFVTMIVSGAIYCLISLFGLVYTIITVYHLSLFLSYYESTEQACKSFNPGRIPEIEPTWKWILFKDCILLSLFVVQHSVMALSSVKEIFYQCGLGTIQRSLYVIATCLSLQCLMQSWEPTSLDVWWSIVGRHSAPYILWRVTHICAWLTIYMGCIVMDILDLLGVRQVYYAIKSLPPPILFKSMQLQRFYQHMRHPSFCCLAAIFWLCPVMTTDRMFLAIMWTVYMAVRWRVDDDDYEYQHRQLVYKTDQLSDLSYQCS